MDYNQFIDGASEFIEEDFDKTIHIKAYLLGDMEVICGYVNPEAVPVDELKIPTQYIISNTYITVEDFEGYLKTKQNWMYRAETKETIENMIAEVKVRLEELGE